MILKRAGSQPSQKVPEQHLAGPRTGLTGRRSSF